MKYVMVKELLAKYNKIQTRLPITPAVTPKTAYPPVRIQGQLNLEQLLRKVPKGFKTSHLVPMELLPINNMSGQSYGYIVYRQTQLTVPENAVLQIGGHVCDSVVVMLDGMLISKPLIDAVDLNGFGFWRLKDSKQVLPPQNLTHATLDLIVENMGRNNFGYLEQFNQFKGLWQGAVTINNQSLPGSWEMYPLEFKKSWIQTLSGWHPPYGIWAPGPSLYKATLVVMRPQDTFLDMSRWTKGIVIVNSFVLGRYSRIGPQQTLYVPAPLLKVGQNEFLIFEEYIPSDQITFSKVPIFKTRNVG